MQKKATQIWAQKKEKKMIHRLKHKCYLASITTYYDKAKINASHFSLWLTPILPFLFDSSQVQTSIKISILYI